jgi:DNA-binding XRE family transcriptional regulator
MKIEPTIISSRIKNKLKERRVKVGYSQEFMAFCLNINQGTYHKIETGKSRLKAEYLIIISVILDIDLNEFKSD